MMFSIRVLYLPTLAPVKHPAGGATVGRVYSDIKSSAKRPNVSEFWLSCIVMRFNKKLYDYYFLSRICVCLHVLF